MQLLYHSTYLETSDPTGRGHGGEAQGRVSPRHSRKRCFPREQILSETGLGDRQESASPVTAHRTLQNRLRFQINKSRSRWWSGDPARESFLLPVPGTGRGRAPFQPSSIGSEPGKQAHGPSPSRPPPPPRPTNTDKAGAHSKGTVVRRRTHECTCSEAIESGQGKGMRRHSLRDAGGGGGRRGEKITRRRQSFE